MAALEEAIANRNGKIYELELEGRQLRSDWTRAKELLEEERNHRERLQEALDSLYAEVSRFQEQLAAAQRRATGTQPDSPARPVRSLAELEAEIRRLRDENEKLLEQREILKKSLGIFSEPPLRGMPRSKP